MAALLLAAVPAQAGVADTKLEFAQLIIRERLVVRVPAKRLPPMMKWKEKRAPKCMSAEGLAGAAVVEPDSIDMIARGGERFRVELASACPGIDFYRGFYLVPSADRMICAGRDAIHARSGGKCQIRRFRKLVPDKD
jgi:hypothetical protein